MEKNILITNTTDCVSSPTAIDIFAGCGGLSQGLTEWGFKVLAAVEIDQLAAETYAENHKGVNVLNQDIRGVTADRLLVECGLNRGELDLLAGCPPCQGFSRMRNKNKSCRLDDPRNRLIDEFARLVEGLLPKVIMLENVPGLARYSRFIHFKRLLKSLGYNICENIADISNYGVPQRRKRLVVLASRIGKIHYLTKTDVKKTVRDAIGSLTPIGRTNDPLHKDTERRSERVMRLIKAIPKDGGSRSALSPDMVLKCHTELRGFYDVYGRMKWDDVAPTITGGCINPSKGRFIHPTEDRAITLREAALLQTFPGDYTFSLKRGRYAVAMMIGNALPPAFSRVQAEIIKHHLEMYHYRGGDAVRERI
ncbi:cytosine-specific methyltransferase [Sporomusaceae bacterium FL31]|nr:cytosine-specific methyltransferase [Sporomusaceae bacterium FL31]GCE32461.1 cytosine-specific methyltransferase [Sporomusaceae bacterium]